MDSAGSCDSVISAKSACSDDSMDHLSAEERACLTYLEEMIDSGEVQEDSGLSNDEPDPLIQTRKEADPSRFFRSPTGAQESSVGRKSSVMRAPPSAGGPAEEMDLALIPPPSDFMDLPQISLLPDPDRSSEAVGAACVAPLPPVDPVETKSPPAVAPKPKRLPANINLKSRYSSTSESSSNLSPHAGCDRSILDPQKVRVEALRKLGLLKGEEKEPVLSPKHSPKMRKSWADPPSPAPHLPPLSTRPDLLPAPAAFCDPVLPSPPPSRGVKSATLERSGPGLTQLKPTDLRHTRPRPASLGSKKEFLSVQTPDYPTISDRDTDPRRALPTQGKLPRSQGISVLISPRAENEDDRREALRKLGLLRD